MTSALQIRKPAVAGMFYPAGPSELRDVLDGLMAASAPPTIDGSIRAIVAPHAGYAYSGQTAAFAYGAIRSTPYDTIVIVSPSHREYFNGVSIFDGDGYQTPLGVIPVDDEVRSAILKHAPGVIASSAGHHAEHAIEVHLPFLQTIYAEFRIVPIVMGDQRRPHCASLGGALASALEGRRALLIASSDLSHYHPYEEAARLDGRVREEIAAFDHEALLRDLESDRVEACGGGPVVAVMLAARKLGATDAIILHHCNSGDVTGDRDGVVGYLSAAFYQRN